MSENAQKSGNKKMAKTNQLSRRPARMMPVTDCGIEEIEAPLENVIEHQMTWKIENYKPYRSYGTNFSLPRGIACTLELLYHQSDEFCNLRRRDNLTTITPVFYVNSVTNKNENYTFKLKVTPVKDKKGAITLANNEKLQFQLGGFRANFPIFTSQNFRRFTDVHGTLTLKLSFSMKDQEQCKVFDCEEYSLERSLVAKEMTKLFTTEMLSDVTILIGHHRIPAHKAVLAMNSPVLRQMLEASDINELKIAMHEPIEAFIELIRFMYSNTVKDLKEHLESLAKLAEEFDVKALSKLCQLEMIRDIHIKYGSLFSSVPMQKSMFEGKTLGWYKWTNKMHLGLLPLPQDGMVMAEDYIIRSQAASNKIEIELPPDLSLNVQNEYQPPNLDDFEVINLDPSQLYHSEDETESNDSQSELSDELSETEAQEVSAMMSSTQIYSEILVMSDEASNSLNDSSEGSINDDQISASVANTPASHGQANEDLTVKNDFESFENVEPSALYEDLSEFIGAEIEIEFEESPSSASDQQNDEEQEEYSDEAVNQEIPCPLEEELEVCEISVLNATTSKTKYFVSTLSPIYERMEEFFKAEEENCAETDQNERANENDTENAQMALIDQENVQTVFKKAEEVMTGVQEEVAAGNQQDEDIPALPEIAVINDESRNGNEIKIEKDQKESTRVLQNNSSLEDSAEDMALIEISSQLPEVESQITEVQSTSVQQIDTELHELPMMSTNQMPISSQLLLPENSSKDSKVCGFSKDQDLVVEVIEQQKASQKEPAMEPKATEEQLEEEIQEYYRYRSAGCKNYKK